MSVLYKRSKPNPLLTVVGTGETKTDFLKVPLRISQKQIQKSSPILWEQIWQRIVQNHKIKRKVHTYICREIKNTHQNIKTAKEK